jgi:hypothetical protein
MWESVAPTTRHLPSKVGTNFADKWQSLGGYSSPTDYVQSWCQKIDEYGEEHNLVPTGWSYGPYSTSSAHNFEDVPGSSGLLTRDSSVATALAWFKSLWLFSVGVPQDRSFQTSSSILGPTKGGHSRRTAPNVYRPSRPPFGRYNFENLQ